MAGAGDGWQAMLSGVLAVIVVIVANAVSMLKLNYPMQCMLCGCAMQCVLWGVC